MAYSIPINLRLAENRESVGDFLGAAKFYREISEKCDPCDRQKYITKALVCEEKAGVQSEKTGKSSSSKPSSGTGSHGSSSNSNTPKSGSSNNSQSKEPKSRTEKSGDDVAGGLVFEKPDKSEGLDKIIGLEEAKEFVRQSIMAPILNPEAYEKRKIARQGNILMYGPPGTGKTAFAKAVAAELDIPFVCKSATELIHSHIGESGKLIKGFFDKLREYVEENDTPIIVFIDEIDNIARSRTSGNVTATETVPALLQELDGFKSLENVYFITATNVPEELDEAFKNRFSEMVEVPLPNEEARSAIFKMKLSYFMSEDELATIRLDTLAKASDSFSGRDITKVCEKFQKYLALNDNDIEKLKGSLNDTLLDYIDKRKKSKR